MEGIAGIEARSEMSASGGAVNVLVEDPDLARSLPEGQLDLARRDAAARLLLVETGPWSAPEETPGEAGALGLLVLEGVLARSVALATREGLELLGTGDLVNPRLERAGSSDRTTVAPEVRWWALTPTRLAVLDARFTTRMCSYPEVIGELSGRLERRSFTLSLRFAIIQQPRLSERLHLLLWHLADRFGRVPSRGMVLPLPLTHELLAQLVGARRPSVSRALKELERDEIVLRRPDGSWWLSPRSPEGVGS